MKERTNNLFLKTLLIVIKGIIVLPLIIFLILEAYTTQNQEAQMAHIQYVAIITTLCWILVLWLFISYKVKHYIFLAFILTAFFQMFFFNIHIKRAHQLDICIDRGYVWDYEQHICRKDCQTWNAIQKCVPL